jgi:hypothetical protein
LILAAWLTFAQTVKDERGLAAAWQAVVLEQVWIQIAVEYFGVV